MARIAGVNIPTQKRVVIALHEVPDDAPFVALMAHAGVNEAELREARLSLVGRLRDRILDIADISEIVTD